MVTFVSAMLMFSSSNAEDDLEEVPYTVLSATETYQLRNYPSARFACVRGERDAPAGDASSTQGVLSTLQQLVSMFQGNRDRSASNMFKKLFRYISGVNQEGQEIPMTRPVRTHYRPLAGNREEQVMCFYVPSAWQGAQNPPQPIEGSGVFIETTPAMQVYTRRFGGFAFSRETWEAERRLLEQDLQAQRKQYNAQEFYSAGYDAPFQLLNRRNEVWIKKMESESSRSSI